MLVFYSIIIGVISFLPFSNDSKVEEAKTFLRENTAQCDQCIYGIDHENRAWEGDIKNQKSESDNLVTAKVHRILSRKEISSIFTDAQGKPIFEDKEGLFYHEDGSVIPNPVIRSQQPSNKSIDSSKITFSALDENKNLLLSDADTSPIPTDWQLKYFGYIGVDPDALAPNGSGLTILQCYLQGIDPVPEEPITMTISATGPFRAPANVTLVAAITHPANVEIGHIDFFCGGTNSNNCLGSAMTEPYKVTCNGLPAGNFFIQAKAYDEDEKEIATATTELDVIPSNRYYRGQGTDINYYSSIIALDSQRGIQLDGTNNTSSTNFDNIYPGASYPWFLRASSNLKEPCYHVINANGQIDYIPVNAIPTINGTQVGDQPPMMAFGSQSGQGTPLYVNQAYHFGIAAGGERPEISNDLKIEVYDKELFASGAINVAPVFTANYTLPRPSNKDDWNDFSTNQFTRDYHLLSNCNGKALDFDTQVTYQTVDPGNAWGQYGKYNFILTHKTGNDSFYYKVSFMGAGCTQNNPTLFDMARNSDKTTQAYNVSYSLDFETPLPWRSIFINQPNFQGIPLPDNLQGKSVDELIHQSPQVVDTLPPPEQIGLDLLSVNKSSELKSHPKLDKEVADLKSDPYRIANYVLNKIELTDAIGYDITASENNLDPTSINPQGIRRDALATYLEGQGSPIEQCALLIYMLRKAGYSAAYVFPNHNTTLMFDQQLSKILKMQLRGTMSFLENAGEPELIPINYPWVVFFDKDQQKWIHLFPWIKNNKVTEGQNLWDYFPYEYNDGKQWLLKYLRNDSSIRNPLGTTDPAILREDNVGTLFPLYAAQQLASKNLTIDDIGIQFINQPCYYESWDEFPRPWQTAPVSNDCIAQSLEVDQNSNLKDELTDIFDTIEVTVISDRENNGSTKPEDHPGDPIIQTGSIRMVNLHDRSLLLHHEVVQGSNPVQYKMILSLDPYDTTEKSNDTQTYTFYSGDNSNPSSDQLLRNKQEASPQEFLDDRDNKILYHIVYRFHQQGINKAPTTYGEQFPGINETTSPIDDTRSLFKGDMACLSLFDGKVSPLMMDFQAEKFIQCRKALKEDPSSIEKQNAMKGQYLAIVGQNYYKMVGDCQQMLEQMTKTHAISYIAHGLTKLSPTCDSNNQIVLVTNTNTQTQDLDLAYPNVDMSFQVAAHIGNDSSHLDSGATLQPAQDIGGELMMGEQSADEHRVINKLYGQENAISTVKLLDIAQGWTSETGLAAHPREGAVILTANNYVDEGNKPYACKKTVDDTFTTNSLVDWNNNFTGWWANEVKNTLSLSANAQENLIIMTPGPITATGQQGIPYTGMGAMLLSTSGYAALITGRTTINGGYGEPTHEFDNNGSSINVPAITTRSATTTPDNAGNLLNTNPPADVDPNSDTWNPYGIGGSLYQDPRSIPRPTPAPSPTPTPNPTPGPSPTPTPPSIIVPTPPPLPTPTPPPSPIQNPPSKAEKNNIGLPIFYGKLKTFVMDPVSVVTGEFYVNALDLKLNGPMPLEIRRIYSSQSTVNETLGHGWKLSYFSYLALSHDSETTPSVIEAAEMDGSVIAYRYNVDQAAWIPLPGDNPTLINENDGTTLASKNLFNNRIKQTIVDGNTTYTLMGADGSKRIFKDLDQKDSSLTHKRPYLDTWSDNQGNFYKFTFGKSKKDLDYKKLNLITSSNGSTIRFNYDTAGHIVEAFSSDGRFLEYLYDGKGDLVQVTLPDASTISYNYSVIAVNNNSFHLLTQEIKPGGRVLRNDYDQQGRVVAQYTTTGMSPTATLSGKFDYKNITANSGDNTINGTTTVSNVLNGTTTTYDVSHNQISKITYPDRAVTQTWNLTDASRSLASTTDARGLTTTYQYDNQGNVTSRSLTGNITGNGSSETATTSFKYNNLNNALVSINDPVGNITSYAYANASAPYNPTSIVTTSPSGQTISSLQINYTNSGGACGLVSSLNNNGSTTTYTYDKHGFPNSVTKKTETGDPDVTSTLSCNTRGDITSATDNLGQKRKYYYDALSRPTGVEVYDSTGARIDWHFSSYNYNGEIQWEQGARTSPVDYTSYDYDRAGHLLHKATYLTTGISSWAGAGVGNGGLATTSYRYDAQGNCTSLTDPNGNITSMGYDNLGEMTSQTCANGANESFTYELGGKVATHTTVLKATESFTYTSTGLMQFASRADGTTTNYRYDLIGRLVQETPSNGPTCNIAYEGNTITRTFGGSGKSTSETYDGRGNLLEKIDLAGNKWSYSYDGLSRVKTEQGPPASGNSAQQTMTHYYSLNFESFVNNMGEWTNRALDAIGRPILTTLFNKDGSVAQKISNHYSGDHQSVETTVGTDSSAITTTTYTDTRGLPLTIQHADGKCKQFCYDANGNLTVSVDEEGIGSVYTYDALNHLASQTICPDGTFIKYECDAAGNLLKRYMPEGLTEQNSYNSAGQKTASSLIGSDGATTLDYSYGYTSGLLSSITDPRGFTTAITYDDWMRPITLTSTGATFPEQNQSTTYTYDPRGLLTSVDQQYNDPSTGSPTKVSRAYDAYGQLTSETTSLSGKNISSWTQTWDAAGRRTALNLDQQSSGAQYNFSYNGLGEMTSAQSGTNTCSYTYGNNGLLSQRTTPVGTTSLTRDARGRITDTVNTIDGITAISEHIDWTVGNRIQSYNVPENAFGLPQESRNYAYSGTKLSQEPFTMAGSPNEQYISNDTHTVQYLYDQTSLATLASGTWNGLGVRTFQYIDNGNGNWMGNYIAAQNSLAQVTQANTYLFGITYDWTLAYDAIGNLSKQSLETFTDQSLIWDSFNHLVAVTQRSTLAGNFNPQWISNYNWKTTYDGLGRRIQTTSEGNTINYYYDPEVEFLELGHNINGSRTWNLYGPDRSGTYGGAQGIGGLESSYDQDSNTTRQWVNNYFGDALGWYDSADKSFSAHQLVLGSYGPMLGSPVPKNHDPQWRGYCIDDTGFYYMGARYYDPINGRFISPDPLGHGASMSLYDYCNGDPVNGLDPDGRCVEGMVTGQSYNVPSYAGALMGRMNPFFSTTQQVFSTGEAYNANYETFGESHWNAINTTFNPAYAAIKGGYEATTGFGMSPNNLGQDLSVGQRIGSGVESVIGAAGTVGIAVGASLVNSTVGSAFAATELTPFETMLARVDELDFSTPRNGAVFYSGPGQGMRAASFAERTGGMTIDMTSGGQWLRENLGVFSRVEQDLIWKKASTPFAEGASGRINAFINGANPERAFRTIEEPILNANQNVWKSTYHY